VVVGVRNRRVLAGGGFERIAAPEAGDFFSADTPVRTKILKYAPANLLATLYRRRLRNCCRNALGLDN
jgi:hypothetical protein